MYAAIVAVIGARHFCRGSAGHPCGLEVHEHEMGDGGAAAAGGGGGGGGPAPAAPVVQGPLVAPQDPAAVVLRALEVTAATPVNRDDLRAFQAAIALLRVALFDGTARVNARILSNMAAGIERTFRLDPAVPAAELEVVALRLRRVREIGFAFVALYKIMEKANFSTATEVDKSRLMVAKASAYALPASVHTIEVMVANTTKLTRAASVADTMPAAAEFTHDHVLYVGLFALSEPPNTIFSATNAMLEQKVADVAAKKPGSAIEYSVWLNKKDKKERARSGNPAAGTRVPKRNLRDADHVAESSAKSRRIRQREASAARRAAAAAAQRDGGATDVVVAAAGAGAAAAPGGNSPPPRTGTPNNGGRGQGSGRGGGFRWRANGRR